MSARIIPFEIPIERDGDEGPYATIYPALARVTIGELADWESWPVEWSVHGASREWSGEDWDEYMARGDEETTAIRTPDAREQAYRIVTGADALDPLPVAPDYGFRPGALRALGIGSDEEVA